MRPRVAAVARSSLRAGWPYLLWAAIFIPIAVLDDKGGLFFSLFCTAIAAVGWAMGFRQRHQSLHGKIDRLTAGFTGLADELRGDVEPEPARPNLRLVPRAAETYGVYADGRPFPATRKG